MNNDLISREQVLHEIGQLSLAWEYGQGVTDCYNIVKNAPTVEERPKGKWIEVEDYISPDSFYKPVLPIRLIKCPFCETVHKGEFNFCSNCGADMRGENK